MSQSDLFAPAQPLAGLEVRLPDPCRCSGAIALLGPGAGPHRASLHCRECSTHRGWVSHTTYEFLCSVANKFGRPQRPITIRRGNSVTATDSSGVEAVTATH
jgi:hypothetical protein